jgi:hypothetical protein
MLSERKMRGLYYVAYLVSCIWNQQVKSFVHLHSSENEEINLGTSLSSNNDEFYYLEIVSLQPSIKSRLYLPSEFHNRIVLAPEPLA